MSTRITRGSLVGLMAGVGLGMVFPPLGAALVVAGAVGGGLVGRALDQEGEQDEALEGEPSTEALPEPGIESASKLLDRFGDLERKLSAAPVPGSDGSGSPGPHRRVILPAVGTPGTGPVSRSRTTHAQTGASAAFSAGLYRQVADAEELLRSGRFLEAVDQFRELKARILEATSGAGVSDRQRVSEGLRLALHRLAAVLIENDSPAEAEDLLLESLELVPDDRDTLLHLARLQLMLERPEHAEPYLRQLLSAHPSDPEAYRMLGDIYIETDRLSEAETIFRQAASECQDTAITLEMLERISGISPENPGPLVELGLIHLREGNLEEAARAFRQANSRAPADAFVQRRLGATLLRLGQTREGLDRLEGTPGLMEDLEAMAAMAHIYAATQQDERALPLLRRFRELDQGFQALDPVERRKALRQYGLRGDQADALYAPLRVRALLDFALVEARSGDPDRAAEAAREALAYGGTVLEADAVAVTAGLSAEFERQGRTTDASFWKQETARLGGSFDRIRQERDTYEEFLRRFRYTARDLIAEGGMARVYRAVDTRTGRTVAVKRMHDRFCTDSQAVAYFYREVRALEELSRPYPHENIVEFIASGVTESRFIFAMEFVAGGSLRDVIDRGELLSLNELCRLAEGICAGLDRAHQSVRQIVHRDLKPENVLLQEGVPKLTDFGICRVSSLFSASRRYLGSGESFVGTSLYSAPEQYPDPYSGQVPTVDARADLYSLGCIMYELLTTQPPFLADEPGLIGLMHQRRPLPGASEPQPLLSPSERNPLAMERFRLEERDQLDQVVMRCLELKPSRRYRSAAELRAEFERIRTSQAS